MIWFVFLSNLYRMKWKMINGIWKNKCKVEISFENWFYVIEEEQEEEDTTVRTYENAVTLYEDKKYYPDAEEVGLLLFAYKLGI